MMDILLSESEWERFSESGSSEGQEAIDFSYGGQATNILSSLEESIGKIDDFLSFDRAFTHGDTVCSAKDPSGQMGRVINVNLLVDLENIHGNIISDVNSIHISKIRSISVGDYVVLGGWLGRIDKVVNSVTVVLDDGSKCEVIAADQEKLLPIFSNVLEDSQCPYYPGQRVKARLSKFSKSVTWLCGTWRDNQFEGTVCEVDAGMVYVDWLASALMGSDLSLDAPPRLQNSKNLTSLSDFSHANWQLGDWCMLPTADCKVIVDPTFINSSTCDKKKLESGLKRRNLSSSLAEIFVIVKTKSKVDVLWQDGSCSLDMDSQTLLPVSIVNSHEFWPEQFVLQKGISYDPHISNHRWGVVQGVDAKEKTVTVQWIKAVNGATDFDVDQTEETLSAYELVEHPDHTYSYWDIVFKLAQNQFDIGKEEALEGKNCSWDQNDCPDKHYLSCIGIVTGFKDGAVEVRWATGFTTKVGPHEIYGIDKYEGSATTPVLHKDNVEELNQEISDKQFSILEGMNLLNFNGGEVCEKYQWELSSFSFPQAAIGFFTRIATSLFGSLGCTSESGSLPSGQITKTVNESEILRQKEVETHDIFSEPHPSDLLTLGKTKLNQELEENLEKKELQISTALGKSDAFRQFDMVCDCSDHNFFGASKGLTVSQVKRAWVKKVQQEWSILERNLPETIYVRIYEDRMDVIRAAIIGAPGTPYHDGLFFFDIFLPAEYPHEPPLVHYISGGLRVNPNLYESGTVCLSLLNTWSGTGSEVWNPGNSTILQVLLSLQALVLNEKPYFNEAGYDKQLGRAEGEKNSASYNENAFLVTCQSMLYLLHKPPKHFKELVEEHFTHRSTYILLACKAYMEGAPVGSAFGCREEGGNSRGCSTGFKIMLAKLFPKLVEAFSGNGINCSQFTEPEKWISCTGSS